MAFEQAIVAGEHYSKEAYERAIANDALAVFRVDEAKTTNEAMARVILHCVKTRAGQKVYRLFPAINLQRANHDVMGK